MQEEEQPSAHCRQCKLPIPNGAKICTHCQSYQDWRRWFSVSTTVLALLTALISVLSFTLPGFIRLVHSPVSELASPIISIEGLTVRVLVNNTGDAPGFFVRAVTKSDYLAGATKVRLREDQKAVIVPGANLLTFDVVPLLTQEESYRNSVDMIELIIQNKEVSKTEIVFQFGESDGGMRMARLDLDAQRLFELMRANSDRCSAVKEPDFYNGCIGPGATPEMRLLQGQQNP